jgi:hypothetical protein
MRRWKCVEALSASTPSNDSESLEGVTLSPRFRSLPRLDLHARAAELFSPGSGYRRVALNRFLSAYERQLKRNRGEEGGGKRQRHDAGGVKSGKIII